jgi:hypothetical protein
MSFDLPSTPGEGANAQAVKALSSAKAKFPRELVRIKKKKKKDFLKSQTQTVRSPAFTPRSTLFSIG